MRIEEITDLLRIHFIHATSLGYIQGAENCRHSILFQGFYNAADAMKLMHL